MDSVDYIPAIQRVGTTYAAKFVRRERLSTFA